jgi:outer membrane lipoprotein LolB
VRPHLNKCLLALSFLFLSACATIEQPRLADSELELLWQTRQQQLTQIKQWRIQGRTFFTQGHEAWNASLRWQQHNERYQIQLLGPFSQGGVILEGDDSHAILTFADGQQYEANDPETLLTKSLSWQLPIEALYDWVRGLPYAKQQYQSKQLDNLGRLTDLCQQGWQIQFKRYVSFNGHDLPSKIFIQHPDITLRLVISSWENI